MFAGMLAQIVNWLGLPVLALIAVLLIRRKTQREFPYFFFYVLLVEFGGIVRFLVFHFARKAYFHTYWITEVLVAVFTFFVSYELFVRRLFPRFFAVTFYRYLFPSVGFIIAITAVPAAIATRKVSLLLTLIHGLTILLVTVLLFFVGLMLFMGRQWTRYEFGIASGLGLQAAAELIASANWARALFVRHISDRLPLIALDIACLIWLVTFLKPEKATPAPTQPVSSEVLKDAKKWQETLKGSLTGKKPPD
ncbi:MAG TPA: hypothetical protein VKD65_12340 [Candidatus Angelobacter sp.]|nr:hypothetical protein [Candidatus Angelobacter sp.]